MSPRVLDDVADVRSLSLDDVPDRPPHATRVLVEPTHFARRYVINPYMHGTVDKPLAREQWNRLRRVFDRYVDDVRVMDPETTWERLGETSVPPEELPDIVFVANHALPTAEGDELVLARMATAERADEPDYFRAWAEGEGYRVSEAPSGRFEGMGDALWHPGRRLLWGGYGVRSDRAAYDELADRLDATVVPLELTDEHYYHLDVCLAPLSESSALIQPDAFTADGLAKIRSVFETVVEAPADESTNGLSVNLEVVGDTVIVGSDTPATSASLEAAGYDVVHVETGEFLKAGGSVCCLTLSVGTPS